jgi:hypothetical protein
VPQVFSKIFLPQDSAALSILQFFCRKILPHQQFLTFACRGRSPVKVPNFPLWSLTLLLCTNHLFPPPPGGRANPRAFDILNFFFVKFPTSGHNLFVKIPVGRRTFLNNFRKFNYKFCCKKLFIFTKLSIQCTELSLF